MLPQNHTNGRSVPEVLQDIAGNIEDIARSEVLLAKVQLKEEAAGMAKASGTLAAGVIFGFYALGFALLAAVYALATVVTVWLAALIVTAIVGIISLALIAAGKTKLKTYAESHNAVTKLLRKENGKWANNQKISQNISTTNATV